MLHEIRSCFRAKPDLNRTEKMVKSKQSIVIPVVLALIVVGVLLFFALRTTPPSSCGNNICEFRESTTCPQDCENDFLCGDDVCDSGETDSCPQDCGGTIPEYCGDGMSIKVRCTSHYWFHSMSEVSWTCIYDNLVTCYFEHPSLHITNIT